MPRYANCDTASVDSRPKIHYLLFKNTGFTPFIFSWAMAKTKAAAKATEDYVRANPWKAMGITAAVGFVLGILVARR
ncbi:MAG: hypothetical protein V2A69_03780 [Pseudomonadota bacterium]